MAIYLRSGIKVEILSGNLKNGDVKIKYDDGKTAESSMIYLIADGGLKEICTEIRKKNDAAQPATKRRQRTKGENEKNDV